VLSWLRLFVGRVQGVTRRFGALAVEELEACGAAIAPQNQEPLVNLAHFPAIDLIADAHPHDLIAGHVIDYGAWSLDGDNNAQQSDLWWRRCQLGRAGAGTRIIR
jgi:hypothetical protein